MPRYSPIEIPVPLTASLSDLIAFRRETGGVAADSLAPKRVGELMFPIAQRFIERSVLVSDDDIRAAQRALWEAVRVVAEPGGAAAFAALLSGKYVAAPRERIAVLVCGANTTAVSFD